MSTQASPKTKTRRRQLVIRTKGVLAHWQARLDMQDELQLSDSALASDLCEAIALLEQALFLQTGGRFGDLHAEAVDVVRKQANGLLPLRRD